MAVLKRLMAHLTTRDMRGNEARDSLLTEMRSENQHCERGMPITSAQSARLCRYVGPGVISVKERRRPRRLGPAYTHSDQARPPIMRLTTMAAMPPSTALANGDDSMYRVGA